MKLDENMRVDRQSIGIVKDKETAGFVDYFFGADLWCNDPRFESRVMKIGKCRGLFRFDRETLGAERLFPMLGDDAGSGFGKAASKVLKELRSTGSWPERAQFASG
jgi:hypothetical protein